MKIHLMNRFFCEKVGINKHVTTRIRDIAIIAILVFGIILMTSPLTAPQEAFAVTNISTCQTLNIPGEIYVLTSDIITAGTCFTIAADGITLDGNGHTITGDVTNIDRGVSIDGKTGTTIKNLTVKSFNNGILITNFGNDNTVTSNTVLDSGSAGISVFFSTGNTITGNTVTGNGFGILLFTANSNTVTLNTALNNIRGIAIFQSSNNNQIYNNNFLINGALTLIFNDSTENIFNLPAPTGGNFWIFFNTPAQGCFDTTPADGFCDTAFLFSNGQDNLPWTKQNGWLNSPPVALNDDTTTVSAPAVLTTAEDIALGIATSELLSNDSDPDGDPLSVTAVEATSANGGTVSLVGATITYTPPSNFNGADTFGYTVSDGSRTDTATVTVTVTPVNDAPVIVEALIPDQSVNEGVAYTFTASATDADLPAQTLTFTVTGTPAWITIDTSVAGQVTLSGTPGETDGGTSSTITISVSDGDLSDSDTYILTVNEVNIAPVLAAIGPQSVPELTQLSFTSTATDPDLPANALTFSLGGTVPAGASITSAGVFTWIPTEAQGPGSFTFDVIVSDGALTDSETITVTVSEVNVAPTANNDASTVDEGSVNNIIDVLANDTALPDTGETLTIISTTTPDNGGTVNIVSNTLEYTPASEFFGTDIFDYTINDGNPGSDDLATVTVTVTEIPSQTPTGADVTVNPIPEVTITFSDVTSSGLTTVTTLPAPPGPDPPGFRLQGIIYDISTTASFVPPITICLSYDPTGLNQNQQEKLKLQHFDGIKWVNIVVPPVDTVNKIICGSTNSLSPFAVFVDDIPPVLTIPSDVTVEPIDVLTPVDIGTATATDVTEPIILTNDSPGSFPIGITVVTWTATDGIGNSVDETQLVTVDVGDGNPLRGQRSDVNAFLTYVSTQQSTTPLSPGTTSYTLIVKYGDTTDSATFSAVLNRVDVSTLFDPAPGAIDIITIPLDPSRNVLKLSIDGLRTDLRTATDSDTLVFKVG